MVSGSRNMGALPSYRAEGHITSVQETRFRLMKETGESLLLTLSHSANLAPSDLCRLRDSQRRVVVEYTGEPNLESGVAHRIRAA
jgi:hypothetical protein